MASICNKVKIVTMTTQVSLRLQCSKAAGHTGVHEVQDAMKAADATAVTLLWRWS